MVYIKVDSSYNKQNAKEIICRHFSPTLIPFKPGVFNLPNLDCQLSPPPVLSDNSSEELLLAIDNKQWDFTPPTLKNSQNLEIAYFYVFFEFSCKSKGIDYFKAAC